MGWNNTSASTLLLVNLLLMLDDTNGLKLLQVSIPSTKLTGQSARLACLYDLEGDTLYSIKWYKGGREFYRYVQRDQPPMQVFPVDGVTVDKGQSDQFQVTLTQLSVSSAGRYKCEVSVDAPSFQTSFSSVEMTVIAVPESGPRISIRGRHYDDRYRSFHSHYRPGDDREIEINCTSIRSKPAAALHWYVNSLEVKGQHLVEYAPIEEDSSSLETTVLGLRWKLPETGDTLVLNCTAAVGSVYWSSTSLTLSPENNKLRPMLMYHGSSLSSNTRPFSILIFFTIICIVN